MSTKCCKSGVTKNNKVIGIGSDHAGLRLKEEIKLYLESKKIQFEDVGCFDENRVDYPDIAFDVALGVQKGRFYCGILCCGTGIGMAMAANKIQGVRAAPCSESTSAMLSRQHNDANILALGGRIVGPVLATEIVKAWLAATFEGGRHIARLKKIETIEKIEQGCQGRKKSAGKTR